MLKDDPELLGAFRRGERLDVVYRAYRRSLAAYLRRLAHRARAPELAQDCVVQDILQEAFTGAFSVSARATYDGTRGFWPYLKVIAHNRFVNVLRKHRSRPDAVADESSLADTEGNQSGAEREHLVVLLDAYLANVPPALKAVYEKRFVLGLSQQAASEALGLSRRSIRTLEGHLCRGARRALLHASYGTAVAPNHRLSA
jgi:RNA polymerase sigma factor (sigma-70 family)